MALSDYMTGMNRAKEEGREEGVLGMVKTMLQQQFDEGLIKSATKVSDENLNKIKKELGL